ncbi:hypothetical protein M408DRAFT_102761 [Serendipita vermifera MAFF 305830]|uniref:WSC domain-containing protein n=1 Tax=Serendipita vermifera MAFF 305830 TaxID=933852 RepID=A0A0C3AQI4_SERVB|nr:hypothetical protein M408DRAFT_102761 [Serendipita vermifera MAFF 305830]
MTNAYCQTYCDSHGYSVAGTEWSKECFCDNSIDSSLLTDDTSCDMTCTGAPEVCGGSARITVRQNQGTVTNPGHEKVGDWAGQGCYVDSVSSRALPTQIFIDGMTIEKCTTACFNSGFKYAGVEYGRECFCADTIVTGSGNAGTPATDGCTMSCVGNAAETCGGSDRINIYAHTPSGPTQKVTVGDWSLKGCYSDAVSNRALPVHWVINWAMTAEVCTFQCFSRGYKFAGLEYASECYCANEIVTSSNSGSQQNDGCDMPCEGAPDTEICGGRDRLTLYEYKGSALGVTPTVLESYNDWNSKGCYVDSVDARTLIRVHHEVMPMTVGTCIDACKLAEYTVAGVEYGSECYCGNFLPPTPAGDGCVMKCDGDLHVCGGSDRLNVYQVAVPPPAIHYYIRVEKKDTGAIMGYIAQVLGPYDTPTYTTDKSAAAKYEKQGPTTTLGLFDLHQLDAPDVNSQYFGSYSLSGFYQGIGAIPQTPPGSRSRLIGSVRWINDAVQSCVWSVDIGTSQLNHLGLK